MSVAESERTLASARRVEELRQHLHDTDRARLHKELAVEEKRLNEAALIDVKAQQTALADATAAGEAYEAEQKKVLAAQTAYVEAVERASALRAAYLTRWRRARDVGNAPLPKIIPSLSLRAQKERGDLLKLMRRLGAAVSTDV